MVLKFGGVLRLIVAASLGFQGMAMVQNDNFWSLRAIENCARRHPIVCPAQSAEYYNAFLYENPAILEILSSILNYYKPKIVVKSITLDRINSYPALGLFSILSVSGEFIFDRGKFSEKMKSFKLGSGLIRATM